MTAPHNADDLAEKRVRLALAETAAQAIDDLLVLYDHYKAAEAEVEEWRVLSDSWKDNYRQLKVEIARQREQLEAKRAERDLLNLEIKALEDGTGATNIQEQFDAQLAVEREAREAAGADVARLKKGIVKLHESHCAEAAALREKLGRVRDDIDKRVRAIKSDSRFQDKPALVQVNAPLALIQVELHAQLQLLITIRAALDKP